MLYHAACDKLFLLKDFNFFLCQQDFRLQNKLCVHVRRRGVGRGGVIQRERERVCS